jgi:hypothetical protein
MGVWPKPGKTLDKWDLGANGKPIGGTELYTLGLSRPRFTIEQPLTAAAALMFYVTCLQKNARSGTYVYTSVPYSDLQAALFFAMETGWSTATGGTAVAQLLGCMTKAIRLVVPAAGTDGGKPMLTAECLAGSMSYISVLTGTTPTVTDADVPKQSTDLTITGITKGMSMDLTIDNGADFSPNAGATPDAINLGPLTISGSISACHTTVATDAVGVLQAAAAAKSKIDFTFTIGPLALTVGCLIGEAGDHAEAGNAAVLTFPLTGVYVDANSPKSAVTAATDIAPVGKWPAV